MRMRQINMKRLIKAHEMEYRLVTVDEDSGRYDDVGEWVSPQPVLETKRGIILPLGEKNLYTYGGRYTAQDVTLISLERLPLKAKMLKGDLTYSIEEERDHTDYSDFYVYMCKAVSSFE